MIQLVSDKELCSAIGANNYDIQEMYLDTDVFYKMFYMLHQLGLAEYFTFNIDERGHGVYVRVIKKELYIDHNQKREAALKGDLLLLEMEDSLT